MMSTTIYRNSSDPICESMQLSVGQ